MKSKNFYLQTEKGLSLFVNGKNYSIAKDAPQYNRILKILGWQRVRWDQILKLVDVKNSLLSYLGKNFRIDNGTLSYVISKDAEIRSNPLILRILEAIVENKKPIFLMKFFDKLLENPLKTAVDELFLFLEDNDLPITEDGDFLAYKNVGKNYMDCHTGRFDNSIGKIVSMPREDVNPDRKTTCSTGLHFCSQSYLKAYPGEHTMVLKINPKNVVAIPEDYNNAKGRCCEYKVIGETTAETSLKDWLNDHEKSIKPIKTKKVLKKTDSKFAKFTNLKVFKSIKDVLKNLPKNERQVGMQVLIENSKGSNRYEFVGGIGSRNLKKV